MIKRVVIAGCRDYTNYEEAKVYIDFCLSNIRKVNDIIIISGLAPAVFFIFNYRLNILRHNNIFVNFLAMIVAKLKLMCYYYFATQTEYLTLTKGKYLGKRCFPYPSLESVCVATNRG